MTTSRSALAREDPSCDRSRSSDVERRFRVTFDGYRVSDADHAYINAAQVQVGAGAVTMQTLSNFILVRVRPMGSDDRLGIEVKEIVP